MSPVERAQREVRRLERVVARRGAKYRTIQELLPSGMRRDETVAREGRRLQSRMGNLIAARERLERLERS